MGAAAGCPGGSATEVSMCGCVDSGKGDDAMSEDKYMVIVVDNAEDFVKELNETADDNWTLHSFQVTLGPVGLLIWEPSS